VSVVSKRFPFIPGQFEGGRAKGIGRQ